MSEEQTNNEVNDELESELTINNDIILTSDLSGNAYTYRRTPSPPPKTEKEIQDNMTDPLVLKCRQKIIEKHDKAVEEFEEVISHFKTEQDIVDFMTPYAEQGYAGVGIYQNIFLNNFYFPRNIRYNEYNCNNKNKLQAAFHKFQSLSNRFHIFFNQAKGEVDIFFNQENNEKVAMSGSGLTYHYTNDEKERDEKEKELKHQLQSLKDENDHFKELFEHLKYSPMGFQEALRDFELLKN